MTVSVATSFIAASLTLLRSPLYGLGYAANDIVLIIMWIMATVDDPSYLPMIVCFSVFFINDCYGFINWRKSGSARERLPRRSELACVVRYLKRAVGFLAATKIK